MFGSTDVRQRQAAGRSSGLNTGHNTGHNNGHNTATGDNSGPAGRSSGRSNGHNTATGNNTGPALVMENTGDRPRHIMEMMVAKGVEFGDINQVWLIL